MGDFFNNSAFNTTQAESSGGNKSGDGSNNNFAHCSLAQVAKGTRQEDGLVLYRHKIKTLCVVGYVESVEELNTRNVYMLNDHTSAPIEVQLWKNDPSGLFIFLFVLLFYMRKLMFFLFII